MMLNFLIGFASACVMLWIIVGFMSRSAGKLAERRWLRDATLALMCARIRVGYIGENPTCGDYIRAKNDALDIKATCWEDYL